MHYVPEHKKQNLTSASPDYTPGEARQLPALVYELLCDVRELDKKLHALQIWFIVLVIAFVCCMLCTAVFILAFKFANNITDSSYDQRGQGTSRSNTELVC